MDCYGTLQKIYSLDELPARIHRGFEAAKAAAALSPHKKSRDRMGASIFAGSRLLSFGFNQDIKSCPTNSFIKLDTNYKIISYLKPIHAEQSALFSIRYRDYSRQKLSLFVYRETAEGLPTSSFPCPLCQTAIKTAGIYIVHFFTVDCKYHCYKVFK